MQKKNNSLPKTLIVFSLIVLFSLATASIVRADVPTLTVSPTSGAQLSQVSVTGNGFGAQKPLTILLRNSTMYTIDNSAQTDQLGNFEMLFYIKTSWASGDYNISAVRQDDASINASAPFTIISNQASTTPTSTDEPQITDDQNNNQDTDDPYSDPTVIPIKTDNSGATIAIIAVVLVAVLIPVAFLFFNGTIGGKGRRNRGYDNPYNQQGPYPYGGGYSAQQGNYPQQQNPQQYGRPASYSSCGGYTKQYSSNNQVGRGTRVCPNCRQVVRSGTISCPYCGTRL
jgi:hypothetical protein